MSDFASLTKQLREKGVNSDSFYLAEYQLSKSDLSEEERLQYLYEQSINSYYLKKFDYGRRITDLLLLVPSSINKSLRDSVFNNSIFYAERLPGKQVPVPVLRPPIRPTEKWTDDPGKLSGYWRPLNPSISRITEDEEKKEGKKGYWLNCRTVNYVHVDGSYTSCEADKIIRTRNFLLLLDENLTRISQTEILDRTDEMRFKRHVQGLEDCRITRDGNRIYFTTTTYDNHQSSQPLISLGTYLLPAETEEKITIEKLLQIPSPQNRCEKNWLPFFYQGKLSVIYSFEPLVIYQIDSFTGKLTEIHRESTGLLCDNFRGSAGPLSYKDGYLAVVHEVIFRPGRHYLHRILELDANFKIRRISNSFYFRSWGIEYCAGMSYTVDGNSLLLTFGFNDGEAWIHQLPLLEIEKLLRDPREPIVAMYSPPDLSLVREILERHALLLGSKISSGEGSKENGLAVQLVGEINRLNFLIKPTARYLGRFYPFNPSIVSTPTGFKVICRTSNYFLNSAGRMVTTHPQCIVQTCNFLLELDDDLSITRTKEIVEKVKRYEHPTQFQGLEDPRLFIYKKELWFTCTTWDTQVEQIPRITLCHLNKDYEVDFLLPLEGPNPRRQEKNWIPFEENGEIQLIYLYSPLLIYTPDLETGICKLSIRRTTPSNWGNLRGSGGIIPKDDGIIIMVHEIIYNPNRIYLHRLLWLSDSYTEARLSEPFYFTYLGVEFASGMTEDPVTGDLIITCGLKDMEAVIIRVPCKRFRSLIYDAPLTYLTA